MTLAPGTRLGPYEIVGQIGAGGMGEVYRAKDSKLHREVAIKVLPPEFAADPGRLQRFQQEARTLASLAHPNILTIFDLGEHAGSPYLAMELLEGETLRQKLGGNPLAPRKAAEIALQVAKGLSAAHEKGILHRDLKPENLFLTKDGRVKILDFGLAKYELSKPIGQESETRAFLSEPGTVVGTSGYMSPEQVRGEVLDARSDLFSLGVILYEMLTGARPFQGGSSVEVMHAILKEDPAELNPELKIPPLLERVLNGCLAKEPAGRFHSAHDLAFALETLSSTGIESARFPKVQGRRFGLLAPALSGAAALLVLALGLGILAWIRQWPPFRPPKQPTFTRLTFKQGQIRGARFTPDGREVVFDAAWDGVKPQIYSMKLDTQEEKPLGIPGATLLYLTRGGDLGVALDARNDDEFDTIGTLAKSPLGGTAPKAFLKDVQLADQAPDGQLAVVTSKVPPPSLEFPLGQRRGQVIQGSALRFSADGRRLAVSGRKVYVLDVATGTIRRLAGPFKNHQGVAWKGDEIWFTAGNAGFQQSLRAVNLDGKERVLMETPGRFRLLDVAEDGRALVAQEDFRVGILHWQPGAEKPRDLSHGQYSFLYSLARDGAQLVFAGQLLRKGSEESTIFLGSTEGPPQVLNNGQYSILSPDGKSVATLFVGAEKVVVYPTGPGQERTFPLPGLQHYMSGTMAWTLDGKALLVHASEPKKPERIFFLPLEGGPLRPLTPEGAAGYADWPMLDLAPDGRHFLAKKQGRPTAGAEELGIYDLQDPQAPPIPVRFFEGHFLGWTADSRRFYVIDKRTFPLAVWEVDPFTGARKLFRTFVAESLPGAEVIPWACRITPDGKTFAATYYYKPSTLYLVEGLK